MGTQQPLRGSLGVVSSQVLGGADRQPVEQAVAQVAFDDQVAGGREGVLQHGHQAQVGKGQPVDQVGPGHFAGAGQCRQVTLAELRGLRRVFSQRLDLGAVFAAGDGIHPRLLAEPVGEHTDSQGTGQGGHALAAGAGQADEEHWRLGCRLAVGFAGIGRSCSRFGKFKLGNLRHRYQARGPGQVPASGLPRFQGAVMVLQGIAGQAVQQRPLGTARRRQGTLRQAVDLFLTSS